MTAVAIVVAAALVVVLVFVLIVRRTRRPDGVAAFQRQIDALSPRARRPVVDKVQQLEGEARAASDEDDDRRDGTR